MNSTAPFQVVPLTSEHDRSQFNCGSEPLNVYFQNQVTQDIRRRVTACFIATAPDRRVAGYYTLASAMPAAFRSPRTCAQETATLSIDTGDTHGALGR